MRFRISGDKARFYEIGGHPWEHPGIELKITDEDSFKVHITVVDSESKPVDAFGDISFTGLANLLGQDLLQRLMAKLD